MARSGRSARVAGLEIVEEQLEVAGDRRDRVLELMGERVDQLAAVVGGGALPAHAVLELVSFEQGDHRAAGLPCVLLDDVALLGVGAQPVAGYVDREHAAQLAGVVLEQRHQQVARVPRVRCLERCEVGDEGEVIQPPGPALVRGRT